MTAVTGLEAGRVNPRSAHNRVIANSLRQWLGEGRLLTATCWRPQDRGAPPPNLPQATQLAQGVHSYAIIGVNTAASPPTVDFVNPWGNGHIFGFPVWGLQWGFAYVASTTRSIIN